VSGIGVDDLGPHPDPCRTAGCLSPVGRTLSGQQCWSPDRKSGALDALTQTEEVDPSSATTRIEFGVCLRALRTAAGLSLRQLASVSKTNKKHSLVLSRSTMEDAELGRTLPRPDWLEVYLAACGVNGPRQRVWKRTRARLASPIVGEGELGRLPRVSAVDPRQLGVHPAITVVAPSEPPGQGRRLPELPPYVSRDVDEELREDIVDLASQGGLIVGGMT
jgi:transcriptional regulator with XRE-family HTH domain